MISINKISIHFTGTNIFDNVSFIIKKRDRIGLVGENGAGKTTLLNIITGKLQADTGNIVNPNNSTIGFLPQEKITETNKNSVFQEALSSFKEILELEKNINKYNVELSEREDYDSISKKMVHYIIFRTLLICNLCYCFYYLLCCCCPD